MKIIIPVIALGAISLLSPHLADSAIPTRKSLKVHRAQTLASPLRYIKDGVIIGGEVGRPLIFEKLLHKTNSKTGAERWTLQMTSPVAEELSSPTLQKKMSYFHIHMDAKNSQIVIDLSDVQKTALSEAALKAQLKDSPNIESLRLLVDPEDRSTSLRLQLRQPVKLAARVKERQLILDFRRLAKSGTSQRKVRQ